MIIALQKVLRYDVASLEGILTYPLQILDWKKICDSGATRTASQSAFVMCCGFNVVAIVTPGTWCLRTTIACFGECCCVVHSTVTGIT